MKTMLLISTNVKWIAIGVGVVVLCILMTMLIEKVFGTK